jgi:hypothetical protein
MTVGMGLGVAPLAGRRSSPQVRDGWIRPHPLNGKPVDARHGGGAVD